MINFLIINNYPFIITIFIPNYSNIIDNNIVSVNSQTTILNNFIIFNVYENNINIIIITNNKIDITKNEGYIYEEELYFEYNNREVFSFLDEVYHMVNNFVLDIKEYIENRSDKHG